MRVIIVHNYYQQPGGEDQVFLSESNLLESRGHRVIRYTKHNDLLTNMDPFKLVISTLWNQKALRELKYLVQRHRPNVIHFHNTFPLISPGSYYAKGNNGPVVIQTLHNFRLICPGALFFRNGDICEKCLFKIFPWPGATNACYRKSYSASIMTVAMLTLHSLLRTWQNRIDRFIALTEFAKEKFIQGGIPSEKIVVKPNFVFIDPGFMSHKDTFALFIGRLSDEKGIITLLNAWKDIGTILLKIVGFGPLEKTIKNLIISKNMGTVEVLGQLSQNDAIDLMKKAKFLLFPSTCYEGFPNTLVEALACGLPVVTSNIGSMAEIIEDGVTGLHFEAGNPVDLADKIKWLIENPDKSRHMGKNARKVFLEKYTAEKNYKILMNIYHQAINEYH
jgi:glycosyltransferase involved in cell wall biosynthesis